MGMGQKEVLKKKKITAMEDKKDALDKYTSKPYPPLEKKPIPTLVENKPPYKASVKAKVKERIKIYDRKGNFDLYNYGHLLEVSFRNSMLTITTTTRIFTLSGKNLAQIAELLGDRQIGAIHEFNPDTHSLPTEPNAPIIESMERTE